MTYPKECRQIWDIPRLAAQIFIICWFVAMVDSLHQNYVVNCPMSKAYLIYMTFREFALPRS